MSIRFCLEDICYVVPQLKGGEHMGYGVGGVGGVGVGGGFAFILVLFILLVIISRGVLY